MTRTQIQLPDELYRRAKAFAEEREISLAEVARRGIELFIDRFPDARTAKDWKLPQFDAGGIHVALEKLHEIATEDEGTRSIA